jgi:SMP-30/Gluconolactonase/LRE-like region
MSTGPASKSHRRRPGRLLGIAAALVTLLLAAPSTPGLARAPLDIELFARIGPPGQPEPVAIGPDGRVYVGTNQLGHGDADAPSKIFAFSPGGELLREYELEGQPLDQDHGIQGLIFDRDGLLYILDRSADPRVVVLNPATGEQWRYASFRDVPPCADGPNGNCSATVLDGPAGPDYGTFSPSGDLYVTDVDQGLIWKVPKGGGDAEVWLTDARLESVFGPNGIQFMADERTLLFANTASNPGAGNPATGRLYTVPVEADGGPGQLTQVWESHPFDGPDGIAIALSGNVYVALAGANQVALLSPDFVEVARTPPNAAANMAEEVPLDGPASLAFLDDRLLVTNHSPIRGDPSSWAVLDVFAGEPGLPLHYPRIYRPGLLLEVRKMGRRHGRIRLHARVTRHLAAIEVPVEGAKVRAKSIRKGVNSQAGGQVRVRGARKHTNSQGEATLRLRRGVKGPILVRARKPGFTKAKVVVKRRPK